MKKHNFSAGPGILPDTVYRQAAQALLDYDHSGLSILGISHRSKEFLALLEEARHLALKLLGLDSNRYEALFLQGSASMEFMRVPYNLLKQKAGYIDTGTWSSKAIRQAEIIGDTVCVASSKDRAYSYIPKNIEMPDDIDYLHFTSNNTIYGTQFQDVPHTRVPLVCDMSSDIYSRHFAYDQIDLIYAGVQKNIGPSGLSLVIVNKEMLDNGKEIPYILDFQKHIEAANLYHTPNVFGVYVCLLNLRWLEELGGVEVIALQNEKKAKRLYDTIDRLDFIKGLACREDRSMMNVTFDFFEDIQRVFFDELCEKHGVLNIKGHRTVGGYRASLYNALPLQSVEILVGILEDMESKV